MVQPLIVMKPNHLALQPLPTEWQSPWELMENEMMMRDMANLYLMVGCPWPSLN